jgi:hypothetical protein
MTSPSPKIHPHLVNRVTHSRAEICFHAKHKFCMALYLWGWGLWSLHPSRHFPYCSKGPICHFLSKAFSCAFPQFLHKWCVSVSFLLLWQNTWGDNKLEGGEICFDSQFQSCSPLPLVQLLWDLWWHIILWQEHMEEEACFITRWPGNKRKGKGAGPGCQCPFKGTPPWPNFLPRGPIS